MIKSAILIIISVGMASCTSAPPEKEDSNIPEPVSDPIERYRLHVSKDEFTGANICALTKSVNDIEQSKSLSSILGFNVNCGHTWTISTSDSFSHDDMDLIGLDYRSYGRCDHFFSTSKNIEGSGYWVLNELRGRTIPSEILEYARGEKYSEAIKPISFINAEVFRIWIKNSDQKHIRIRLGDIGAPILDLPRSYGEEFYYQCID